MLLIDDDSLKRLGDFWKFFERCLFKSNNLEATTAAAASAF